MSDDEPTTRGTEAARWQRVLLKLSGEAFAGPLEHGIHGPTVRAIAEDIVAAARQFNVDIAVVVENCPHTLLKLSVDNTALFGDNATAETDALFAKMKTFREAGDRAAVLAELVGLFAKVKFY